MTRKTRLLIYSDKPKDMKRFRVIEDRQVSTTNGQSVAKPIFYIEEMQRFLFFCLWDRWPSGFSTKEEAQSMIDAMNDVINYKSKVL